MTNKQKGFSLLELILTLFVIGTLIIIGLYVWHQNDLKSNEKSATKEVLLTLRNPGSTNLTGWNLVVYSDGAANLICNSEPQLNKSCTSTSYKSSTSSATKLSRDLSETHLDTQYACVRSASFGSSETLIYKGKSINGIDCYFSANPNSSLSRDIVPFLNKANLN